MGSVAGAWPGAWRPRILAEGADVDCWRRLPVYALCDVAQPIRRGAHLTRGFCRGAQRCNGKISLLVDTREISLDTRGISLHTRGISLDTRGISLHTRGISLHTLDTREFLAESAHIHRHSDVR